MPNHQGVGRTSPRGERGITGSPQESGIQLSESFVNACLKTFRHGDNNNKYDKFSFVDVSLHTTF